MGCGTSEFERRRSLTLEHLLDGGGYGLKERSRNIRVELQKASAEALSSPVLVNAAILTFHERPGFAMITLDWLALDDNVVTDVYLCGDGVEDLVLSVGPLESPELLCRCDSWRLEDAAGYTTAKLRYENGDYSNTVATIRFHKREEE